MSSVAVTERPAAPPVSAPGIEHRPSGRRAFPTAMVAASLLTLAAAFALQLAVFDHGGHTSLSDLPHIVRMRGISAGRVPYLDRPLEYPVGAGLLLYLAGLVWSTPLGVLVVTALGATAVCVGVTVALERRYGGRAWRWAVGTPVALFAFQNWDVFAIGALVAGLLVYRDRRRFLAGALVGLGAVVKLFPAAVLPVLIADRLARRDRRGAVAVAAGGVGVVVLANLPVALANFDGWWWQARFQGARNATWGGIWFYLYRWTGIANVGPSAARVATDVSAAALVAGIAWVTARTWRRRTDVTAAAAAAVVVFVVANKVYSPTYDVWLVAFFVMLPVGRRLWLGFCAVDLAVYVVVFGFFHGVVARETLGAILPYLVVTRTVMLLWLLRVFLRTAPGALGSVRVLADQPVVLEAELEAVTEGSAGAVVVHAGAVDGGLVEDPAA